MADARWSVSASVRGAPIQARSGGLQCAIECPFLEQPICVRALGRSFTSSQSKQIRAWSCASNARRRSWVQCWLVQDNDDLTSLRSEFPIAERWVYFDHATYGPHPRRYVDTLS